MPSNLNAHTFGTKSRIPEFIYNHIWLSTLFLSIGFCILTFFLNLSISQQITAIKLSIPIFILCTILFRFAHNNGCYKLSINKDNNTILLQRMFNKGIVEANLTDISIQVDRHINIIINDEKYYMFNVHIGHFANLLPSETKIKFKGILGRYTEKEWLLTKVVYPFWPKDNTEKTT